MSAIIHEAAALGFLNGPKKRKRINSTSTNKTVDREKIKHVCKHVYTDGIGEYQLITSFVWMRIICFTMWTQLCVLHYLNRLPLLGPLGERLGRVTPTVQGV